MQLAHQKLSFLKKKGNPSQVSPQKHVYLFTHFGSVLLSVQKVEGGKGSRAAASQSRHRVFLESRRVASPLLSVLSFLYLESFTLVRMGYPPWLYFQLRTVPLQSV